jgi:hypothetical protein
VVDEASEVVASEPGAVGDDQPGGGLERAEAFSGSTERGREGFPARWRRRIAYRRELALSRAWCAGCGAEYMYPFRCVTGAEPCCRTCGVRWLCEMSLSRRRGAGGLGG